MIGPPPSLLPTPRGAQTHDNHEALVTACIDLEYPPDGRPTAVTMHFLSFALTTVSSTPFLFVLSRESLAHSSLSLPEIPVLALHSSLQHFLFSRDFIWHWTCIIRQLYL